MINAKELENSQHPASRVHARIHTGATVAGHGRMLLASEAELKRQTELSKLDPLSVFIAV